MRGITLVSGFFYKPSESWGTAKEMKPGQQVLIGEGLVPTSVKCTLIEGPFAGYYSYNWSERREEIRVFSPLEQLAMEAE